MFASLKFRNRSTLYKQGYYLVCPEYSFDGMFMGETRADALLGLAEINIRRYGSGMELIRLK